MESETQENGGDVAQQYFAGKGLARWLSSTAIAAAAEVTGCTEFEAMTIIHRHRILKEPIQRDADLQVMLAYEGARAALFRMMKLFTALTKWSNRHG